MSPKVLIIDAHPVYAPKITAFLEGLTITQVQVVSKSNEVLDQVNSFAPDVIILSAMLPDTDACQLLVRIKKDHPALNVIVQYGLLATPEQIAAFKASGASSILPRLEKDLTPLQEALTQALTVRST